MSHAYYSLLQDYPWFCDILKRSQVKNMDKRHLYVTPSDFGSILGCGYDTAENVRRIKKGEKSTRVINEKTRAIMEHGNLYEKEAVEKYTELGYSERVITDIFLVDYKKPVPFIAGNLDGIDLTNKCVIEVKCPNGKSKSYPKIKLNHYLQMQGYMYLTDLPLTKYVLYFQKENKLEVYDVAWNPSYWEYMEEHLLNFWKTCI